LSQSPSNSVQAMVGLTATRPAKDEADAHGPSFVSERGRRVNLRCPHPTWSNLDANGGET
jgi:hypothetical protein